MKNKKFKMFIIVLVVIAIIAVSVGIWLSYKNSRDYDIPDVSDEKYFLLYDNGKYGVIDTSGNIVIEANYDEVQIPNPTKPVFFCLNGSKKNIYNSSIT